MRPRGANFVAALRVSEMQGICPGIPMRKCLYEEDELCTWVSDRPDKGDPLGIALSNSDVPAT